MWHECSCSVCGKESGRRAAGDPHFFATDDCAVVMTYMPGAEITVVPGEETNIKLTYADDAARIEDIIRRRAGK